MSRARRIPLLALVALVACDPGSVDPGGETSLALQVWTEGGFASVADAGTLHLEGPTPRTLGIAPGDTRVIEGLDPGAYTVTLEAFSGGQLESMDDANVTVVAGQTATANISLRSFVPTGVSAPPQATAGQAIDVVFSGVTGATGYRVEWDDNPSFSSPQSTEVSGSPASITIGSEGTFHVRVRARNRFGSTSLPGAPSQVQVSPPATPLEDATPLHDREGAQGSQTFYTFEVPAGGSERVLQVRALGGSGDADLALRHGSAPTLDTFDCASVNGTVNYQRLDFCSVQNPSSGTWHVMLYGAAAYEGVTIEARLIERQALTLGVPQAFLSGGVGDILYFRLDVPGSSPEPAPSDEASRVWSGSQVLGLSPPVAALPDRRPAPTAPASSAAPERVPGTLYLAMGGGSGDPDLGAGPGADILSYQGLFGLPCFPFTEGAEEICEISDPAGGSWTLLVLGFAPFSDVAIAAEFVPPGHALTVTGSGDGHVGGGPIDCTISGGAPSGACSTTVPAGTQVTLTATPAEGFQFDSWSGDCSGSGGCTVTMDAERNVHANFTALPAPPVISNPRTSLVEVHSSFCSDDTRIEIQFDFTDANGNVPTQPEIRAVYTFSPSNFSGVDVRGGVRGGTGASGDVTVGYCVEYGGETGIRFDLSTYDDGGLQSNELSISIPKPEGSTSPPSGAGPARVTPIGAGSGG